MSEASKLADELNQKLDTLHDTTVSDDPFSWQNSEADRNRRSATFREISEKLNTFTYVPKTGTVLKILLFGTGIPLLVLVFLYLNYLPTDEDIRLWVWGGLGAVAVISAIVAAIVADDPNISSDLCLATYTIPRDWSFSRTDTEDVWERYRKHFGYFDQGDEDQEIRCRIWGFLDDKRKRPFQLFHFYFETVYYTTEFIRDAKGNIIGTRQVKHEVPHHRYGMFAAMPESKVHFCITENGGTGYDTKIKLEYGELNKAVNVGCNSEDELAVRQFLSPAVQEIVMQMSNDWANMHIDFYPGLVLVVTHNDFLDKVGEIELDENATRFAEFVKPAGDLIEGFRATLAESLDKIKKYNDNY